MIVRKKEINPKQKRYDAKEKLSHILYMLNREEQEEEEKKGWSITAYCHHNKVSRQTLYSYKQQFIEDCIVKKAGRKKGSKKPKKKEWKYLNNKEKIRITRTILCSAVSPASIKEIKAIVKEAFEIEISKRKIKEILVTYSEKAERLHEKLQPEKYAKFIAIDEIFSGNRPILTGVDLHSFAVVICQKSEKRDGQTWKKALENFENLELVTSDQAKGIISAVTMTGVKHQFDLFHLKRDIGKLLRHLETQAYREIETEYKSKSQWEKTKKNKEQLLQKYQTYQAKAIKSIYVFDEIEKSIKIIYKAMDIFDKKGNFIDPQKSLKKIYATVERMKKVSKNKKIINIAKRIAHPKSLLYLIDLKDRLLSLPLCWKKGHTMTRKKVIDILAKHYFFSNLPEPRVHFKMAETKNELLQRRRLLKKKLEHKHVENLFDLRILQMSLANFDVFFSEVTQALSKVFRSSSLVESFNSQVRIAQQVKKSLPKNFLALSALKWNMTPFEGGKRKGKSPFQLLGIFSENKDWLNLLLAS